VNRREIRERVEEALQDIDNRRWTNAEINRYIDDAQREFVRISRQPQVTATVALAASGAATAVAGTTTVDSKTVTVTTETAHGLSTGDTVVVDNQSYVITVLTETIFRYLSEQTQTVGITYRPVDPTVAVPESIEEIVSASIDGINLVIMSEGELDAAVFRYSSGGDFLNGVFGVVPNPFTTIRANYTVNATPKWRERNGPVEAIVFNHASADTFRIFPLPSRDEDLFIDPDATTKVFKEITLRGLPKISDTTEDTTEPIIGHYYHEALVFGALERAYNREGQTRNTEKGQVYRASFMEMALEAKLNEGINSFSRSEGRNESYFRVVR
jgi:hypothetical protein